MNSFQTILDFWFTELDESDWWKKDDQLDTTITERFKDTHNKAIQCELYHWRSEPEGRLAEIIVLDQFSRNIYRNHTKSFLYDSMALTLAQEAVSLKADKHLSPIQKAFLYLPYMHSESAIIHEEAVKLFSQPGLENNLDFEHKHKVIIDRFGRYPHRNLTLGRKSTAEEIEFLKQPNSSF